MASLVRCGRLLLVTSETLRRAAGRRNQLLTNRLTIKDAIEAAARPQKRMLHSLGAAEETPAAAAGKGQEVSPQSRSSRAQSSPSQWKPLLSGSGSNQVSVALHNINLNVRRTGRVLPTDVASVMQMLRFGDSDSTCTSNDMLLLLRCCGSLMHDEVPESRMEMAKDIWKFCEESGVKLDISHYNAMLKVMVENSDDFSPSEYLADMERRGMEANRVTYQHLIAKYCQKGDIDGATTILEHMKNENMAVNENVFQSLIMGHARSGDFEAAKGVMKIMEESGIDVGSEARLCYILELARAGKGFEEDIKKEMLDANNQNIFFSDHDLFRLMVEFVRAGRVEEAGHVVDILPRKSGFFQEMRNIIPEIIHLGEVDLPYKIYESFRLPLLENEGHKETTARDQGLFILRAMIKSQHDPLKVLGFMKKLSDPELLPHYASRMLEACVDLKNIKYGQQLYDAMVEEFGEEIINPGLLFNYVRNRMRDVHSAEETMQLLIDMVSVGLRPMTSSLSQSFLPKLLQKDVLPISVMTALREGAELSSARRPISLGQFSCAVVQYLLNQENMHDFRRAIGYLLHVDIPMRPHFWNASLARSYLATDNMDGLIAILACTNSTANRFRGIEDAEDVQQRKDEDLFKTLNHIQSLCPRYKPETKPDAVLRPVLQRLFSIGVGVPQSVASLLRESMEDEVAIELTHQLSSLYEDRNEHWTKEKCEELMEAQKKTLKFDKLKEVKGFIPISRTGFIDMGHVPEDLEGLEKASRLIREKGLTNNFIDSLLVQEYLKQSKLGEAEEAVRKLREASPDYVLSQMAIDAFVNNYVKGGEWGKAKEFLEKEVTLVKDGQAFANTYVNLAVKMVEAEKDDEVMDLLNAVVKGRLISRRGVSYEMTRVLVAYAEKGNVEKLTHVFEKMKDLGLVDTSKSVTFNSLIDVHLHRNDLDAAVEEFENIARVYKKLPQKHLVMEKLIAKEDMEKMQRVLDASIEVVGEEKSLYDLAANFLNIGKTSQAKKLLATPGLRYNHHKVSFIINKFIDGGHLVSLENFVHLCQPVFSCDRDYMYSMLVKAHRDSGNNDKAQDIWLMMQEEGHVPSDKLKVEIARMFEAGGHNVPFEVPEGYSKKATSSGKALTSAVGNKRKDGGNEEEASFFNETDKDLATRHQEDKKKDNRKKDTKIPENLEEKLTLSGVRQVLNYALEQVTDSRKRLDLLHKIVRFQDSGAILRSTNSVINILKDAEDVELLKSLMEAMAPELRQKFMMNTRVLKLEAARDPKLFVDNLEKNVDEDNVPRLSVLLEALNRCSREDKERMLCKAEDLAARSSLLAMEALKACLLSGEEEWAERLWQRLLVTSGTEPPELPFTSRNLAGHSAADIGRVLDFARVKGFDDRMVGNLTNQVLSSYLKEGQSEAASSFMNEVLESGQVSLDTFSNNNLRAIANIQVSEEVKRQAAAVLGSRRSGRGSLGSNDRIDRDA